MKRFFKPILLILGCLGLLAFAGLMMLVRPLLVSRDYVVTAKVDGESVQAKLMRPAFTSGVYYLELEAGPSVRDRMFLIREDSSTVALPISVYKGVMNIPYVHADQMRGILLTDGKVEDTWEVHSTPDKVKFANASISVQMERRR
jgi:hypothetical protein